MQFANCKITVVIISCDFMMIYTQNKMYLGILRISFAKLTFILLATIIDFSASRQY